MFLDGGDGFAMRMSSWDACYSMARNHPDAVFMLYSRLWDAEAVVMRRRDIASGLAFTNERFRQAPAPESNTTVRTCGRVLSTV